jgi:glucose/mannose transport system permease protein
LRGPGVAAYGRAVKGESPIADATALTSAARRDAETRAAIVRWRLGRVAIYGVLAIFAVIYLLPAFVVVANAFRTHLDVNRHGIIGLPSQLSFDSFAGAWTETCVSGMCEGIGRNFFNSLWITVPATLIATAFGALNGYVLSKWRFPGSEFIFWMVLAGMFLPGQITLLPWAFIMGKLGLANNVNGLIIIHCVQGLSFATLFCRNFYAQLPDEVIKAARIDGAGFWRIFRRVVLPLSGPILAVTVIWEFTSIWNEYLFGMIFTAGNQQPMTVALMGAGAGRQSAAVLIAALPPVLVFLVGGRYFVRGLTMGAIR